MEPFIRVGGLPDGYRCEITGRNAEDWARLGERSPVHGCICVIFWVISQTLYIPPIIVLLQRDFFSLTVYKLMLIITICDVILLLENGLLNGVFLIQGAVYCTYPNFIYIVGIIDTCAWVGACCTCTLLAFTRLIELFSVQLHETLFSGRRIYISLSFVGAYVFLFFLYCKPVLFNSQMRTWIFDPLIKEDGSDFAKYFYTLALFNNFGFVLGTFLIYLTYFGYLYYKLKRNYRFTLDWKKKQIMLSTCMLCFNNFALAFLYSMFTIIPVGPTLMFMSLIMWQVSSAGGIFVYYIMNRTIRNRIFEMVSPIQSNQVSASNIT